MPFNTGSLTPETFIGLGTGLLSGGTWNEQLANAGTGAINAMNAQKEKQKQQLQLKTTADFLQDKDPNLAVMVRNGAMTPADAYKQFLTAQAERDKRSQPDYMSVDGLIFDKNTKQWIAPPKDMVQQNSDLGLNLQYGVDKDGNPVPLQVSKDGRLIQSQMPEGVSLSKEPIKLDAGTHFVLIDPITRQPISTIPKNVAEVEKQKVLGETEGKNVASAPADLQAGLNAKDLITSLKTDPNREWGTGISGWLTNSIPASPGYDFQTKVDQAKSGAFATAIQQMRGLGSLSNAEGETATKAVTRMNTATSEKAFLDALDDYEKIIDQGIDRAKGRIPNVSNNTTQSNQPIPAEDYFK